VRSGSGAATYRVAVLDDYQVVAEDLTDWGRLGPGFELVFFHDHVHDADRLVNRLAPFDVVVAMRERTRFPRDVLARLPRLGLLVTKGMANAAIDVAAADSLGITVAGTDDGWLGATATIELTWGLILALARGIPAEDAGVRHGAWQRGIGTVLAGKRLGIIGLGNLGALMPPMGRVLGMDVVAWSRNLTAERAAEVGVERVGREELFATSDVITVHLKLGDRSRGYVGRDELDLMKPTALLVNTSRGPVVDEDALVAALADRRIGGAALDVYDTEPLPVDHPLRYLPNTVLTPHIGYVTVESYRAHFTHVVDDLLAFAEGRPVRVLGEHFGEPSSERPPAK
jgi:phosphoglycerate dehydrogenase-like enzyme